MAKSVIKVLWRISILLMLLTQIITADTIDDMMNEQPRLAQQKGQYSMSKAQNISTNAEDGSFGVAVATNASSADLNTKKTKSKSFIKTLFKNISTKNAHANIVYSPMSLQMLLAILYACADGKTANQLAIALQIPENRTEMTQWYQKLLQLPQYNANNDELIVASKIIYNSELKLNETTKYYISKYLNADFEATQFTNPNAAAAQINAWIANKTQNRIPAIVSAQTLDPHTSIMLLNAIYFKSKWAKEFSTMNTEQLNFYNDNQRIVPVDIMYNDDTFRFANMTDLNATMLELPYKDSDLSMWIILPNAKDGFADVLTRLSDIELNELSAKLKPHSVIVRLPKFRIEFEQDMKLPLRGMGVKRIFSSNAELPGFFPEEKAFKVSKILQRAYIDVNEAGSEAAAASFANIVPLMLPAEEINFTADHPFIFVIKSPLVIYFVGHVVNF